MAFTQFTMTDPYEAILNDERYDIIDHQGIRYLVGSGPDQVYRFVRQHFQTGNATGVPVNNQKTIEAVLKQYTQIMETMPQ